jgi:uncharacterized protein DUF4430
MENETEKTCSRCGPCWRLPLLLALVLGAIVCSQVARLRHEPSENNINRPVPITGENPEQKVELTIDFGRGKRKNFEPIAWHADMTVADAMNASSGVNIAQKGSGESALVTAIDGVENQGSHGLNWTYGVNGKMADRSFAVYELKPGDRILWTFGARQ